MLRVIAGGRRGGTRIRSEFGAVARRVRSVAREGYVARARRHGSWLTTRLIAVLLALVVLMPAEELPGARVPPAVSEPDRNCDAARAAGAAPIYRGEPGYGLHLDRDRDGIACEPYGVDRRCLQALLRLLG